MHTPFVTGWFYLRRRIRSAQAALRECEAAERIIAKRIVAGELQNPDVLAIVSVFRWRAMENILSCGEDLFEIARLVDRFATREQKLDLLSAGRRPCVHQVSDSFAEMLGAGLEQPADRHGNYSGPLWAVGHIFMRREVHKRQGELAPIVAAYEQQMAAGNRFIHAEPMLSQ
ncbi:hypothetical protein ACFPTO_02115 [Paraburkholderia denitrificans]|uniref:Uncharacterized protein n=1 Tax=Paraburkholderia denitrificans TaxID=694025 RepID=A0ABW0J3P2_9BURK